jgi:regulator of protease activity HflC (stomatin/prohibitin superfamily)
MSYLKIKYKPKKDIIMEKFQGKFIGIKFWNVFFAALAVIGVIFIVLLSFILPFLWAVFSTVVLVLIILGSVLAISYKEIPHKYVAIVEEAGEYIGEPVDPGWYFFFPFGDFIFIKNEIFMGDQELALFEDDDEEVDNENSNAGKIDFEDGVAAKIKACLYFRVVDAGEASYSISNFETGLKDKFEDLLRAYFGSKKLDDAIGERAKKALMAEVEKISDEGNGEMKDFIKRKWGIEVYSLLVLDIILSEKDVALRRKVMEAQVEENIAHKEKARRKTLAEARELEIKAEGAGLSAKIQAMKDAGASPEYIMTYFSEQVKWENLGDKSVIIDNGDGIAGVIKKLKALGL